jgi:SAM-dependent methyltransferase
MSREEHWEKVYAKYAPDEVGWYAPHLETSLKWIQELLPDRNARILDAGGGASTLVDDLLAAGYTSITVVDLSARALALARERLQEKAERVTCRQGDITSIDLPPAAYDLWHDRAVFHFLTEPGQRERYRSALLRALCPGGHVLLATFAPEAPPRCSGLPVERYDAEKLAETLGTEFEPGEHLKERHVTPGGVEQMYVYRRFRRVV